VGEYQDILIMDDYGHHPTAIRTTIEGIKAFWPHRRVIVDFMSHTYSRTIALQDDFIAALDSADCILLHKIYPSAREQPIQGFSGKSLFEKLCERRPELVPFDLDQSIDLSHQKYLPQNETKRGNTQAFIAYSEEPLNALDWLLQQLRSGDIFLTMGAGDNFKLGKALADALTVKSPNLKQPEA